MTLYSIEAALSVLTWGGLGLAFRYLLTRHNRQGEDR